MNTRIEDAEGHPVPGDLYQRWRGALRGAITGADDRPARRTAATVADAALALADLFHLVARLATDPAVPARRKGRLAAALVYRLSPIDLLPEALLGPIGLIDDLALLCWALDGILNDVPEEVLRRHWAGSPEALEAVRHAVAIGDELLGVGLLERAAHLAGTTVRLGRALLGAKARA